MGKIILIAGLFCTIIYIGGFFGAAWIQEKLIYPISQNKKSDCEKGAGKKTVVQDGVHLYHQHREDSDTVVVFYHGNGDRVCDVSFLADTFNENGVSYIFPEYVGYSGDERKPSHEGVLKTVEETIKYIDEQDYKKVYVIGQSIGSGAASYHVTLQEPDKLLLFSPFTTLTNVVDEMFPVYPRFLITKFFDDQFNNQKRLENYTNELVIVHGTKDPVVRLAQGKKLFDSIPSDSKELIAAKGYGHANLSESQEVIDAIKELIQ